MNEYELYHYGVLGMKWGVRRYQNEDGSLTDAGMRRYGRKAVGIKKKFEKADKFGEKAKKENEKKYKYYSRISPRQLARGDTSGSNYKKAKEAEMKETKYIAKQHKLQVKGKKKLDKMISEYGLDYVNGSNPELINRGKEKVALLIDRQLKDYTL